jgi:hypothetical protein
MKFAPTRKITFEISIIEIKDEKEEVIYRHKPKLPCYNRQHLHNLLKIAVEFIFNKFNKGEL